MESETDWLRKYSSLNAETCSTSSEDSYVSFFLSSALISHYIYVSISKHNK